VDRAPAAAGPKHSPRGDAPLGIDYDALDLEPRMILGIDPKVDFAFKYLLGRDSTRPILIDMLNSVLQPPAGHEIREIELLNPFNLQEAEDDKLSVLDIKARDQSGRGINLEMQMLPHPYYDKRIVYYGSRMHQQQLHQGQGYGLLRPTISISFLNHVLFPDVPDHHLRFRLLEDHHHFPMSEDFEFHILELPKFTRTLAQLTGGLDVWLYFLRFAEMIDPAAVPPPLQQPAILRAVEELKMLTQTDIERERYESRRKAQLDHISAISAIDAARSELEAARSELEAARIERDESLRRGQQIGEQIGTIHAFEKVLQRSPTPSEQLLAMSLDDLKRLVADLSKQVLNQS
jgi:predicted transposase/invertase (TIGR01784 family)